MNHGIKNNHKFRERVKEIRILWVALIQALRKITAVASERWVSCKQDVHFIAASEATERYFNDPMMQKFLDAIPKYRLLIKQQSNYGYQPQVYFSADMDTTEAQNILTQHKSLLQKSSSVPLPGGGGRHRWLGGAERIRPMRKRSDSPAGIVFSFLFFCICVSCQ